MLGKSYIEHNDVYIEVVESFHCLVKFEPAWLASGIKYRPESQQTELENVKFQVTGSQIFPVRKLNSVFI